MFIPVIGPLILLGWHVSCLWARGDRDDPAEFPAFDFNNAFGKYLQRGVWPFVVGMVASLVVIPLLMLPGAFLLVMPAVMPEIAQSGNGAGFALIFVISLLFDFAALAMLQLVATPLVLKATLTQDFATSFDFAFVRSFVSLTWKEILMSMLFMAEVSVCMVILAIVTCYIGAILAAPVVSFSWHHLQKQIYQTYLARGGKPVPRNALLSDLPPPLPVPASPPPLPGA